MYGTTVDLKDGTQVRVDESYIRESVLYPQAKIVGGYDGIMPTFKGLITEDGMLKLIEYIKSLGPKNGMPDFGDSGADADQRRPVRHDRVRTDAATGAGRGARAGNR